MASGKNHTKSLPRCLVTGVTGYIGGRLVPELLKKGYPVRVLTRDASRLEGRSWHGRVEIVEADVLEPGTLPAALAGVSVAYYLIHSMGNEENFYERDVTAAQNFGREAKRQGLDQIIYLGGLGDPEEELSPHLASRQLTGEVLRESGVPVTEFRAAIVVGSGSISFEMIRYLTERIPVMICPSWVYSKVQPIAIRDVLKYLVEAVTTTAARGRILEIGGRDVITYGDMMRTYAKVRGLRRWLVPVPVLSPTLSSYWVHWMTPVPASMARPLIKGLKNNVVVRDSSAREIFPDIHPVKYVEAVRRAIDRVNSRDVETTWNDALASSKGVTQPVVLQTHQGMIIERRVKIVKAGPGEVFKAFSGLGGEKGWLSFNWAWKVRGILDRLAGGVGFRRGRRHPDELRVGDVMDFWRVEAIEKGRRLRLRAEMKVPGQAWLEFRAEKENGKRTKLIQTAFFDPKGLFGLIYWYTLYPIHSVIFSGLIHKLAEQAEEKEERNENEEAVHV